MSATTCYAGWLPPIRVGGSAGWLAFKTTSLAAISGAIVHEPTVSARIRDSLYRSLVSDPALLLFTVASSCASDDAATTTIPALIQWWCQNGRSIWRDVDWLTAPTDSIAAVQLSRFAQLEDYFHLLPLNRWVSEAGLWFAAAGIDNPIGDSIKLDLSAGDMSLGAGDLFTDAHLAIASWIRNSDNREIRNEMLADAVDVNKRELAHTLAYGLSHEINNPLANILTRAQALQTRVPAELVDSMQRIVDQTTRAHAMIADLMFYANPPAIQSCEFDLLVRIGLVIESFQKNAARLGIEICFSGANGPLMLIADEEMIGEAIAALVRNSIDAIGTDGHVRVVVTIDEAHVQIMVADSGPGISPDAAKTALSPYYSGREAGRGLGLGLCRADRIVRLHGGSLQLTPALAGCVATIAIPVARHSAEAKHLNLRY